MQELPPTTTSHPPSAQPPAPGRQLRRVIVQDPATATHNPAQAAKQRSFIKALAATAGAVLLALFVLAFLLGNNRASGGTVTSSVPVVASQATASALPTVQTLDLPTVDPAEKLPGTPMPDEGGNHVSEREVIHYKSDPPSSGPHNPSTAELGFSYKVLPIGRVVHNLEHGAVVIYYSPDLPESDKESLRKLFDQLPRATTGEVKLVVTPYPGLKSPMVLAAWMRLLPLQEFDYRQIFLFYRAWMGKGPEGTP